MERSRMIGYVPGRRRTAGSVIRRWSFNLLVAATLFATIGGLVAAMVLAYRARPAPEVVTVAVVVPAPTVAPYVPRGPDRSLPPAYSEPIEVLPGLRTALTVSLHLGPDVNYAQVGVLQAGATLEVVGRDESGEWLAVVFPPNSTLRAWLPVGAVDGVVDVDGLTVEPAILLD